MNTKSGSFLCIVFAVASCMGATMLSASADILYFNNKNGGSGTWEGDAGGTPWFDSTTSALNVPWNNTAGDIAHFQGAGGTVDVAADVSTDYMYFDASSAVTLNGPGTITVVTANPVLEDDTAGNVTIDNNIQLNDNQASDRFDITDTSAGTITLNGNISYVGTDNRPSGQALIFNGGTNTNFVLGGSFQGSSINPGRLILSGGSLTLNGTYTNANTTDFLEIDKGTVYLGSSTLGTGPIYMYGGGSSTNPGLLTTGAQTITNLVTGQNISGQTSTSIFGSVTVGGSTADISSFGTVQTVATGLTVTAANGGRVNFGSLTNNDVTGLIKIGAGTVVLTADGTYTVHNGFNNQTAPYLADIQQGTLLDNAVAAKTQSAFGPSTGNIQVEAGATLGGSGSTLSTQKVVVKAATGVITAGDPGQTIPGTGSNPTKVIAPTIGTFGLNGGLEADNGLTLDFKLNGDIANPVVGPQAGINNDLIFVPNLTLAGTVTVNMTALDPLATGVVYTLMEGPGGSWSADPATVFNVIAPTGYVLDQNYFVSDPLTGLPGTKGYVFDTSDNTFTVQFELAPEPSTYGLMGLGLVLLLAARRFVARTRVASPARL